MISTDIIAFFKWNNCVYHWLQYFEIKIKSFLSRIKAKLKGTNRRQPIIYYKTCKYEEIYFQWEQYLSLGGFWKIERQQGV